MGQAVPLPPASAGLGLRRGLLSALQAADRDAFDFLECAPENWIGVGCSGAWAGRCPGPMRCTGQRYASAHAQGEGTGMPDSSAAPGSGPRPDATSSGAAASEICSASSTHS